MLIANSFIILMVVGSGFISLRLSWAEERSAMVLDRCASVEILSHIFSLFLHDDTELFKSILWKWAHSTVPNGFTPFLNIADRSATRKWYCSNGPLILSITWHAQADWTISMGMGYRWWFDQAVCHHECGGGGHFDCKFCGDVCSVNVLVWWWHDSSLMLTDRETKSTLKSQSDLSQFDIVMFHSPLYRSASSLPDDGCVWLFPQTISNVMMFAFPTCHHRRSG